jgi:hypothetical protein
MWGPKWCPWSGSLISKFVPVRTSYNYFALFESTEFKGVDVNWETFDAGAYRSRLA